MDSNRHASCQRACRTQIEFNGIGNENQFHFTWLLASIIIIIIFQSMCVCWCVFLCQRKLNNTQHPGQMKVCCRKSMTHHSGSPGDSLIAEWGTKRAAISCHRHRLFIECWLPMLIMVLFLFLST